MISFDVNAGTRRVNAGDVEGAGVIVADSRHIAVVDRAPAALARACMADGVDTPRISLAADAMGTARVSIAWLVLAVVAAPAAVAGAAAALERLTNGSADADAVAIAVERCSHTTQAARGNDLH